MSSSLTPLLDDDAVSEGHQPLPETFAESPNRSIRSARSSRSLRRLASLFLSPLTGEEGRGSIVAGLSLLVLAGSAIGAALPKNPSLPTDWYRWVSSCVGYTYFLCWSVSFYPQVVTNYKRKSTEGLSPDFCALNVLGFGCYAAYNLALFYSTLVQQQYRARHGPGTAVTVQSNDVAFAVHAFALSSVTLLQIGYYDGFRQRPPSKIIAAVIVAVLGVVVVAPVLVCKNVMAVLDFLYLLSYMKIGITLIKYVPQVILNYRRKSTRGWSIWQILLDFSGGVLSDLQLVFDCLDMGHWAGITGNLAKLSLGLVSICFDTVFMLQHYVWYGNLRLSADVPDEFADATSEEVSSFV